MDKIFSAFISSTAAVVEYRQEAVDSLHDMGYYCFCMEHFTVHDFDQIKTYIKNSDFVLLIIGTDYGSVDIKTGKSWTQLEFEFAKEIGKSVLVIKTPELDAALQDGGKKVDKLQKKFCKMISEDYELYSRTINARLTLSTVLAQYVAKASSGFAGWSRSDIVGSELKKWQEDNAAYDINGTWYHYHYSESDRGYIKLGTIEVTQEFTPDGYALCRFEGMNYGVEVVGEKKNKKVIFGSDGLPMVDDDYFSTWEGEYKLQTNGTYTGIYHTTRHYKESDFDGQEQNNLITRGIHDFVIGIKDKTQETTCFKGVFHDEAPSVKEGKIFICRTEEERNNRVVEYLKKYKKIAE